MNWYEIFNSIENIKYRYDQLRANLCVKSAEVPNHFTVSAISQGCIVDCDLIVSKNCNNLAASLRWLTRWCWISQIWFSNARNKSEEASLIYLIAISWMFAFSFSIAHLKEGNLTFQVKLSTVKVFHSSCNRRNVRQNLF